MYQRIINFDWSKTGRRAGYAISFVLVAGVAAYVSYGHISEVALLAHQPLGLARVLPLSVDGVMLIATLAMAEDKAANRYPRRWARVAFWFTAAVSIAANIASTLVHYGPEPLALAVAGWAPIALLLAIEIVARPGKPRPPETVVAPVEVVAQVATPAPAITASDAESPSLPEAPVSPAVGSPKAPAAAKKSTRKPYGPRDGEEYSERQDRRLRNGK